jgi:tRNA threonylcarbamoyladenosine modification (KEOPS) complex Cgi121 subunit
MQYHLAEYGKYIEITGYRGIAFAKAEEFLKINRKQNRAVETQFFDADLIATPEHLYFAILNALQAIKDKTNISKSAAMETMLYASAQRQIQKAIERCGIKPQTTRMAVVAIGQAPEEIGIVLQELAKWMGTEPDETVLAVTKDKEERIKKAFEVSDQEINTINIAGDNVKALVNLVVERVALLATQF